MKLLILTPHGQDRVEKQKIALAELNVVSVHPIELTGADKIPFTQAKLVMTNGVVHRVEETFEQVCSLIDVW